MMVDNDIKVALQNVMEGLLKKAQEERLSSQSYKDLFEASRHGFEGLLRKLDLELTSLVLSAVEVIQQRTGGNVSNEIFNILLALPYISGELERNIQHHEGSCCCVDKSFYLLANYIQETNDPK